MARRASDRGRRQPKGPPLSGEAHRRTGEDPRHPRRGRIPRTRSPGRPGPVGAVVVRREASRGDEGRSHRLGPHRRRQRIGARGGADPVRSRLGRNGRRPGGPRGHLRLGGSGRGRHRTHAPDAPAGGRRPRNARAPADRSDRQHRGPVDRGIADRRGRDARRPGPRRRPRLTRSAEPPLLPLSAGRARLDVRAAIPCAPGACSTRLCRMTEGDEGVRTPITDEGSVELIGVTKRFGTVTAVDALDIQVRPGEFLSLLGPSGCGKTTTLRMLAGFEDPDEGQIRISGTAVQGVPPHKRNVNTVFQNYALFPHMTASENVAYGLRQKKVAKAEIGRRVGEALEMVKMSRLAARKPREMSGGQQQRIALARALVNRPSLLLLDEPLGALDRKLREEMQIELKLLQSQVGITFVFVTHDQDEALSMSDRIAVMLDGRVEQLADPDTIYDFPASAFVAGFIGQQNFFDGTARQGGTTVEGDGWTIRSSNASPD